MWIKHRCFSFFEKRFGWFLYHFVDRVRDRTRYTHRSREAQHHTDISTACHMHSNKMGILQCEGRFLGWNGFILEGREHSKWDHSIVSQVGHFLNILATFWYWMSPRSMYTIYVWPPSVFTPFTLTILDIKAVVIVFYWVVLLLVNSERSLIGFSMPLG